MTELDSLRTSTRAADELLAALDCDGVTFPPLQSELSAVGWKRRAQEIALEAREILQVRLFQIERSHLP